MQRFLRFEPCELLRPFVSHFAISESDAAAEYAVLPDTGLVLGFQYRGSLARLGADAPRSLAPIGITGLQPGRAIFANPAAVGSVLVFFRPAGAAQFFRIPLHELFAASVSLDSFLPAGELAEIRELLHFAASDQTRVRVVENFLLVRLQSQPADLLVLAAIRGIRSSRGTARIGELAAELGSSQSSLEKRFRAAVGATPKKFAAIVRLRSILDSATPAANLAELAARAGYYDQSHFIHDFRAFTGETPEQFFRAK